MATLGKRWAIVAMACGGVGVGCASTPPPEPVSARSVPAASFAAFTPGTTDPARKAKFLALAPRLDEVFEQKRGEAGAAGFAVGIVLDGEIVYERGFGVTDLTSGRPVDKDSVFRVGSVTKGFTALAIMKLRDEGKLSLDEPISTYLPEAQSLTGPTRDSPPITARLLLSNASGIGYDDLWGAVTYGKSDREFLRLLGSGMRITHAPGTKYAYSNFGFSVLGKLIEKASGLSYSEYLRKNILLPLGMTSSGWRDSEFKRERRALGYYREDGKLLPEAPAYGDAFLPAGGLYASIHDLTRYVAYHLLAYPPRDAAESGPVRRSTLREMHQGQRWMRFFDTNAPVAELGDDGIQLSAASYGFGWFNTTSCGEEGRVSHGGYDQGYYANVSVFPEFGLAMAFLATGASPVQPARPAALRLLERAGLLAGPPAPAPTALVEARAVVEQLVLGWDDALVRRTFDPDSLRFSFNQRLKSEFERLYREHGHCRRDGELTAYTPLHGEFSVSCERGRIRFEVLTLPNAGGTLQNVEWKQELTPDARSEQAAAGLVAALSTGGDETSPGALFAASVDRARAKKTLRRLSLEHGDCKLERGRIEKERDMLKPQTPSAIYELTCSERPLVLSFKLDETSGKISEFSGHPPRSPTATCWQ